MAFIVITSGHGKYIRGAVGPPGWGLDEVDEARRVCAELEKFLTLGGHRVIVGHDDYSTNQSDNLDWIVDFHNSQDPHDLDVSIHFNAYTPTEGPMGPECLYLTQADLADRVSKAVYEGGQFGKNRGPKKRTDLAFLNGTNAPAILIETCFVDSADDVRNYEANFTDICMAIANVGTVGPAGPPAAVAYFEGKASHFGGPQDMGVAPDEGLAFFQDDDEAPTIFLPQQPPGTTGLARRLDPETSYVACRWDYDVTPKAMLRDQSLLALVRLKKTGKKSLARPADWGPHQDTGRAADLSPGLLKSLGGVTDDEVEVTYPYPDPGSLQT